MIDPVDIPNGTCGRWTVERFTITKTMSEATKLRAMIKGRGYIPPGVYTQLHCEGRGIVMSDTPDKRRDHYEPVIRAHGHVLINGLGIGMVLAAVLKKQDVIRVTVVEIDPDVITLVRSYRDNSVKIINASAFDYKPPKGERYGMVWHDIRNVCGDNIAEMTRLKRKYGRHADWQGCWGEWECRHGI